MRTHDRSCFLATVSKLSMAAAVGGGGLGCVCSADLQ